MSALSKIACLSRRSRKIRCEESDQGTEQCKRCYLTNIPCYFQEHHRGKTLDGTPDLRYYRKRKGIASSRDSPTSTRRRFDSYRENVDSGNHQLDISGTQADQVATLLSSNDSSSEVPNTQLHNVKLSVSAHASPRIASPKPSQDFRDGVFNSKMLDDQDLPRQGSAEGSMIAEPSSSHMGSSQAGPSKMQDGDRTDITLNYIIAPNIRSDALANGIASWDRLEILFNFYLRHIDPHTGLLDADHHTLRFTRQYYPLLFSAVTTVAAMFLQASKYLEMTKCHEALDAFATLSEYNCLDRVLAKTAMLIWTIGDVKGNRRTRNRQHRIHQLLTDAIDLSLHMTPSSGSSHHKEEEEEEEGEMEKRERACQRRTWVQLCLIQRTYQSAAGNIERNNLILGQEAPTSASFLAHCDPEFLSEADYRLAASLEIAEVQRGIDQTAHILQSRLASKSLSSSSMNYMESRLSDLSNRLSSFFAKWFIKDDTDVYPRGKLSKLAAQELYYVTQANRFHLNQITWSWASCSSEIASKDYPETAGKSTEEIRPILAPLSKHLPRDEAHWFSQSQFAALEVLKSLNIMQNKELTHNFDLVYVPASKVSLWLSRYSAWFSPVFLSEAQQVMSSLIQKCMMSSSRQSNSLFCFVRLVEVIVRNLSPTSQAANNEQIRQRGLTPRQSVSISAHDREQFTGEQILPPPSILSFPSLKEQSNLQYSSGSDAMDQWQQNWIPSPSATTAVPTLDLWRYPDFEDLQRWEQLFNIDLQLGSAQYV